MTNPPNNKRTVAWETEEFAYPGESEAVEYRYPTVFLGGGLRWEAHHSVSGSTSQVDGRILAGEETIRSLDVYALGAPDSEFESDTFDLVETRAAAQAAWDDGSVLVMHGFSLMVPHSRLDGDELAEVINRFNP